MRLRCNNFFFQQGDLFEIGPTDLLASDVNICICDAQYLRNNISWDEKYRGVRCRSKQHGVWALLLKQFWLGMSKLLQGGILIFRFGWRDPGPEDIATIWYKKCTLRLFSILHDLFAQVREVKSDYFNALQSSFYVCCAGFDRARFEEREIAKLFGQQFNYLLTTRIQDSNDLEVLEKVDKIRTREVDQIISDMLDRVDKLRIINQSSRRWHHKEETKTEDPRAVLFVAPIPEGMGQQDLDNFFSVYGIVLRVDCNGCEEASIQFAKVDHAQTAVLALRSSDSFPKAFGVGARVWMRQEEASERQRPNDSWAQEWSMTPSAAAASAEASQQSSWADGPGGVTGASHEGQPSWASKPSATVEDASKARATPAAPPGNWGEGKSKGSKGGASGRGANGGGSNGGYSNGKGADHGADRPDRSKDGAKGQQAPSSQQPRPQQQKPTQSLQQQQRQAAQADKLAGWPKSGDAQPQQDAVDEAPKPDLHPALQDHQARTKDLIAQLLKPK